MKPIALLLFVAALLVAAPGAVAAPDTKVNGIPISKLVDAKVGHSTAELRAQITHSGHVVAFFERGKGRWMTLPRQPTCELLLGKQLPICVRARETLGAHRWLHQLSVRRLGVALARQERERAARRMANLERRAEWSPQAARELGHILATQHGYSEYEWSCIDRLWGGPTSNGGPMLESDWSVHADNPHSDAYGIPQALPGEKMGDGWRTSARVQITWGFGYVDGRYGGPCGALSYRLANGYY